MSPSPPADGLTQGLKHVARKVRNRVVDVYVVKSYARGGEDIILSGVFGDRAAGFFVDVGAHHPQRFSKTYLFYKRGWRGINIEPNSEVMYAFRARRPRDITLQLAVSDQPGRLAYYQFDEPALNTFDGELAKSRVETTPHQLLGTAEVTVERLDRILTSHLPEGQAIEFLSIDAERLGLAVLRSNDWARFRPKCVLVEAVGVAVEETLAGEVYGLLRDENYELFAKTFNTLFFRQRGYDGR